MSYEKEVEIDGLDLYTENLTHSAYYLKYAEKASHASVVSKRAKEKLEVARCAAKLRAKESDEKVSDKKAEWLAATDKNVAVVFEEYMQALDDEGTYRAAAEAFSQRKSNLENLTKLHLNGFFSEPKEPKNKSFSDSSSDEKTDDMNKKIKRKKTKTKIKGKK
jgi:hypothetical protein